MDSISANIAEGFGRHHKKDKEKFYFNARTSTLETFNWIESALKRRLISPEEYKILLKDLSRLPKEINTLIKLTDQNLTK